MKNNTWNNYRYSITKNAPVTSNTINLAVNSFWKNVVDKNDLNKFAIQMKVAFNDGRTRSITKQRIRSKDEKQYFKNVCLGFWSDRTYWYHQTGAFHILFTYRKVDDKTKTSEISLDSIITNELAKNNFIYKGLNLPNNTEIATWGTINYWNDNNSATIFKKEKNKIFQYNIELNDKCNIVSIYFNNSFLYTFTDYIEDLNNLYTFKRVIDNTEYHYLNGELVYKSKKKHLNYMVKLQPDRKASRNIITMDLETRTINGVMEPICLSVYNGENKNTYFLSDYLNSDEMIKAGIKSVMIRKYDKYRIYFHNFSYFDGIFILKLLPLLGKVPNPIVRNSRIIKLTLEHDKGYRLYFHDSYLLLPSSLDKLGKSFNVENKGIFPLLFVNNKAISLNYKGEVPEYKYFININYSDYLNYKLKFMNKEWNLKEELIKYCEQDVVTLHQVISKFSKETFDLFNIDVVKYPTLSSLAFAIYRIKFMDEKSKIPIINAEEEELYNDIKEAYTGGIVDVYKPFAKNVKRYDVNSLYPDSMRKYKMPVGSPTFFEGDIFIKEDNPFGFFYVEVYCPIDLKYPVLQHKIKTRSHGVINICPTGNWKGWYFSEELKDVKLNFGYKFKVLKGWSFESDYLFIDYVDFLYNIKCNTPKSDPRYLMSKLLLNSLYGRFGMSPYNDDHAIVSYKEGEKFNNDKKFSNVDITDLLNGYQFVSYNRVSKSNRTINVSVVIAAAITAYSRISNNEIKKLYSDHIVYHDTDSFDLENCDIDPRFVGKELGKLKLEHTFKEACYLAPKVYGGITDDYSYVKIKGLKDPVSYWDLKSLLYKDNQLKIPQEKWVRSVEGGFISIHDEIYTLMITENKRQAIYDSTGKYIDNVPFQLENGKLISRKSDTLFYLPKLYKQNESGLIINNNKLVKNNNQRIKSFLNKKFIHNLIQIISTKNLFLTEVLANPNKTLKFGDKIKSYLYKLYIKVFYKTIITIFQLSLITVLLIKCSSIINLYLPESKIVQLHETLDKTTNVSEKKITGIIEHIQNLINKTNNHYSLIQKGPCINNKFIELSRPYNWSKDIKFNEIERRSPSPLLDKDVIKPSLTVEDFENSQILKMYKEIRVQGLGIKVDQSDYLMPGIASLLSAENPRSLSAENPRSLSPVLHQLVDRRIRNEYLSSILKEESNIDATRRHNIFTEETYQGGMSAYLKRLNEEAYRRGMAEYLKGINEEAYAEEIREYLKGLSQMSPYDEYYQSVDSQSEAAFNIIINSFS
jgi:hypothetical protein